MTKREKRFDFCWGSVRWRDFRAGKDLWESGGIEEAIMLNI